MQLLEYVHTIAAIASLPFSPFLFLACDCIRLSCTFGSSHQTRAFGAKQQTTRASTTTASLTSRSQVVTQSQPSPRPAVQLRQHGHCTTEKCDRRTENSTALTKIRRAAAARRHPDVSDASYPFDSHYAASRYMSEKKEAHQSHHSPEAWFSL